MLARGVLSLCCLATLAVGPLLAQNTRTNASGAVRSDPNACLFAFPLGIGLDAEQQQRLEASGMNTAAGCRRCEIARMPF